MNHDSCPECIAKAKLRNRDMDGMKIKAKKDAVKDQESKAICWNAAEGLYITSAVAAIRARAIIRAVVSFL